MTKSLVLSDLIDIVQIRNRDLPPDAVEAAMRRVFSEIIAALADGRRVELRGFGALGVRDYPGHEGRNPRNGELVRVPARRGVHWKTGKALAQAIQDTET